MFKGNSKNDKNPQLLDEADPNIEVYLCGEIFYFFSSIFMLNHPSPP
jgi:hypothetical protein